MSEKAPMTDQPIDIRRKRLLHRARYRGFKEADILIGGFAEAALPAMLEADRDGFEEILNAADHDIYGWIVGHFEPPPAIDRLLIERMRAFDAAAKAQNG